MDAIYLICLLVGGFFVLLSMFGGHDTASSDMHVGAGIGHDVGHLGGHDVGHVGGHDVAHASGQGTLTAAEAPGPGLVDIFSVRTLFLFAAFFGLSGTLLSLEDAGEPFTALVSLLVGSIIGIGGNYAIRRITEARVSSSLDDTELCGHTGRVLLPFEGAEKGKIQVEAKGRRVQLIARAMDQEMEETFRPGDEVVVVRMHGAIAEVVKPE